MDAVWLVGPRRQDGYPLRYSIRSVVAHLPMVTRVVTVGYRWPWLSDAALHIEVQQAGSKHVNTYANLRAAVADARLSGQFVLMNDDFFVLAPVCALPVLHAGRIADRVADHERAGNHTMRIRRQRTLDMLRALGIADPLDYELHVPMVVDRAKAAAAYGAADAIRPAGWQPTGKRSLYGNLAGIGGRRAADVKVHGGAGPMPAGPFVSTSASSWLGRTGALIRVQFRAPSRYERR